MPVAIERGGVIPGIIVLIVAAAGAWSLFGALCMPAILFRVPGNAVPVAHTLVASCSVWRVSNCKAGYSLLANTLLQMLDVETEICPCISIGPIWSWPATFLFGKARATGIAAFNTLGALGGFTGAPTCTHAAKHCGGCSGTYLQLVIWHWTTHGDVSVCAGPYIIGALSNRHDPLSWPCTTKS